MTPTPVEPKETNKMLKQFEGCGDSFQISYIKVETLRPSKEMCWLITAENMLGSLSACSDTVENAVNIAREYLGV